MKTRVITAAVFVPVLLLSAWLGGIVFTLVMLLVAILAGMEYGNMLRKRDYYFPLPLYIIGTVLLFAAAWFMTASAALLLIVLLILFLVCYSLFIFGKCKMEEVALTFFSFIYIAFFVTCMVLLRLHFADGLLLVLLVFIIQWITDTGAFLIGITLGKHKLAPLISPKKTIEGAVGGVVTSLAVAIAFNLITHVLPMSWLIGIVFCGSICGQLGDLAESALKRWAGVKDAGNILPGHGGILDRFDSMLFIAPFLLIVLSIITNFL